MVAENVCETERICNAEQPVTTHPQILLLARPGLLDNEAELTEAIHQHGYPLAVVRSSTEFFEYLKHSPAARIIAVVQQRSVIEHLQDMEGYITFLRSYAHARESSRGWRQLALFVIYVPIEQTGWVCGFNVETGFLKDPAQPYDLIHFIQRVVAEVFEASELPISCKDA